MLTLQQVTWNNHYLFFYSKTCRYNYWVPCTVCNRDTSCFAIERLNVSGEMPYLRKTPSISFSLWIDDNSLCIVYANVYACWSRTKFFCIYFCRTSKWRRIRSPYKDRSYGPGRDKIKLSNPPSRYTANIAAYTIGICTQWSRILL